MAGSRTQGPIRFDGDLENVLATPPGPLGKHRRTDTRVADHRADTPGPVGVNDAAAVLASGLLATPFAARRPAARQTSQTLTPVAFANRYHNTRVSYLDPHSGLAKSVTVDVHIYNNYGILRRRANMSEKATLVGRVRRELRRAGGLRLIGVESNHKVQMANSDPKKMIVVESSGSKGGLVESEYTILEVRNKIFKVDRGRPAGGVSRVKFVEV